MKSAYLNKSKLLVRFLAACLLLAVSQGQAIIITAPVVVGGVIGTWGTIYGSISAYNMYTGSTTGTLPPSPVNGGPGTGSAIGANNVKSGTTLPKSKASGAVGSVIGSAAEAKMSIISGIETNLQGSRALTHASAMMTMETMSGFRNAMAMYRSGRAFSFGAVSLDNIYDQELLASIDPIHDVPQFDREVGSWHSFVQMHGLKAHRDNVTGLPGGSIRGQGITTGLFYQLNPELVTGVMLSVHNNSYGYKDNLGSGFLESVRVGPFASWSRDDFHADASLTLAHNNYTLSRNDLSGSKLKSRFSGQEMAGYMGVGYDVHLDNWAQGLTLTPMAELLYIHSRNGGYAEKGFSNEALAVGGGSGSQLITRYGVEVSYLFPNLESPTELKGQLGMQHHRMSGQNVDYRLQAGGSGSMNLPFFAERAAFVGLGVQRKVSDYSHISLSYNGTRSSKGLSHGLQFNFESRF